MSLWTSRPETASRNISKRRTMPIKNRGGALNQFAILFDGRVHNSITEN
jgi:hypothetical protein